MQKVVALCVVVLLMWATPAFPHGTQTNYFYTDPYGLLNDADRPSDVPPPSVYAQPVVADQARSVPAYLSASDPYSLKQDATTVPSNGALIEEPSMDDDVSDESGEEHDGVEEDDVNALVDEDASKGTSTFPRFATDSPRFIFQSPHSRNFSASTLWEAGDTVPITWTCPSRIQPKTVTIKVLRFKKKGDTKYNRYVTIASRLPAANETYEWSIPENMEHGRYMITIEDDEGPNGEGGRCRAETYTPWVFTIYLARTNLSALLAMASSATTAQLSLISSLLLLGTGAFFLL